MVLIKTLQEFERVVRRFPLNDMQDFVLPEFPETTWAEVKKIILKENIDMNSKSLAKILARVISKFDEPEVKRRIGILLLVEASLHSSKRKWSCHYMQRQGDVEYDWEPSAEQMGRSISQACRIAGLGVIQHVICRDTFHWIMIVNKKIVKGKGIVFQKPHIFAYLAGDNYLFAGQKETSNTIVMAVANALHFKKVTDAKLEGRHIPDLMKILVKKEGCDPAGLQPKPFKTDEIIKDGDNIVILPNKNRRRYAESVFGENPPKIEKLTIYAPECPWESPLMQGETIDMQVVITAPNVYGYLTDLSELGIMSTPYPTYIENIAHSGKNTIVMRPAKQTETSKASN